MNNRPNRIDQILYSFAPHDAIGFQVLRMQEFLRQNGFVSEIFAEEKADEVSHLLSGNIEDYLAQAKTGDVTLFHFSVGSNIPYLLEDMPTFRVCFYHNITPPQFFDPAFDIAAYQSCLKGHTQMGAVRRGSDFAWTVSEFNASELTQMGFPDAVVTPLWRNYENLSRIAKEENLPGMLHHSEPYLLFVGRVNPNKGHQDILRVVADYKEQHGKCPPIVFVGGFLFSYFIRLERLAKKLGLRIHVEGDRERSQSNPEVFFFRALSDEQLAAIYRKASLFFCLSDHEGFCAPLIEAMAFELPVIAHRATAVGETCGNAALLVDKTQSQEVSAALHKVITDKSKRQQLAELSRQRFADFSEERLAKAYHQGLEQLLSAYSQAVKQL